MVLRTGKDLAFMPLKDTDRRYPDVFILKLLFPAFSDSDVLAES